MRFKNKVALLTGGARDIGKAIAIRLASEGAHVIINYAQSEEAAHITLSEITAAGGKASLFKADLTKADEVKGLKDFVINTTGNKLDVLINNAGGIVARKKLSDQDESFYDAVMDLNFKSLFLVTHAFADMLLKGSAIVNVSSLAARDGGGNGASLYAAAKGAITAFHDKFTSNEVREKVVASTPLRREGTSEEVANLVAFLASEEASFITGANYDINGGIGLF